MLFGGYNGELIGEYMRVIEITKPGGSEVLRLAERARPEPGPGEILIALAHAGVNRPDILQRQGLYAPPKSASDLPGLEGAGRIAALGPGVTTWKIGDEVCALLPGGGYAEYALCPASHALPVPKGLSLRQAAALPEACFTVWSNVFQRAGLKAGEILLVHGGTSGIGTTAIPLAKALGARVFATAGSAEKCKLCCEIGAEAAFNYRESDFVAEMRALGGAHVILDMIGGEMTNRNLKALADDGRLQQIAFVQGAEVTINLAEVMTRRLHLHGSTLRPQSLTAKARIARELLSQVWPLYASGKIAPILDESFPLEQAALAHERMESGAHFGKITLSINP